MKINLHHIAILTEGITKLEESLPKCLKRFKVDIFKSEGTKEQYVDLIPELNLSLLLIEAIGEGPYKRALKKRGIGLHHFGFLINDLQEAIQYFHKKGLLLHPISLQTIKNNTVWMCRPGVPFLVELNKTENELCDTSLIIKISIPNLKQNINWIPGYSISKSIKPEITIHTPPGKVTIYEEPYKAMELTSEAPPQM